MFKSEVLESGEQIFLQLGGTMEKVSAMVIDANEPISLNEEGEDEIAFIKNKEKKVIRKQGPSN